MHETDGWLDFTESDVPQTKQETWYKQIHVDIQVEFIQFSSVQPKYLHKLLYVTLKWIHSSTANFYLHKLTSNATFSSDNVCVFNVLYVWTKSTFSL